jgi:hypothetical protein
VIAPADAAMRLQGSGGDALGFPCALDRGGRRGQARGDVTDLALQLGDQIAGWVGDAGLGALLAVQLRSSRLGGALRIEHGRQELQFPAALSALVGRVMLAKHRSQLTPFRLVAPLLDVAPSSPAGHLNRLWSHAAAEIRIKRHRNRPTTLTVI